MRSRPHPDEERILAAIRLRRDHRHGEIEEINGVDFHGRSTRTEERSDEGLDRWKKKSRTFTDQVKRRSHPQTHAYGQASPDRSYFCGVLQAPPALRSDAPARVASVLFSGGRHAQRSLIAAMLIASAGAAGARNSRARRGRFSTIAAIPLWRMPEDGIYPRDLALAALLLVGSGLRQGVGSRRRDP